MACLQLRSDPVTPLYERDSERLTNSVRVFRIETNGKATWTAPSPPYCCAGDHLRRPDFAIKRHAFPFARIPSFATRARPGRPGASPRSKISSLAANALAAHGATRRSAGFRPRGQGPTPAAMDDPTQVRRRVRVASNIHRFGDERPRRAADSADLPTKRAKVRQLQALRQREPDNLRQIYARLALGRFVQTTRPCGKCSSAPIGRHLVGASVPVLARQPRPSRSASSRAMWARSSGTPSPSRDEVKITSGIGGDMLAQPSSVASTARIAVGELHLVALGQHDGVGDGGGVEQRHRLVVAVLQPVAAVDQHEDAQQRRAAAQIVARELAPGGGLLPSRRRRSRSRACRPASPCRRGRRRSAPACGRGCWRCGRARCVRSAR